MQSVPLILNRDYLTSYFITSILTNAPRFNFYMLEYVFEVPSLFVTVTMPYLIVIDLFCKCNNS